MIDGPMGEKVWNGNEWVSVEAQNYVVYSIPEIKDYVSAGMSHTR